MFTGSPIWVLTHTHFSRPRLLDPKTRPETSHVGPADGGLEGCGGHRHGGDKSDSAAFWDASAERRGADVWRLLDAFIVFGFFTISPCLQEADICLFLCFKRFSCISPCLQKVFDQHVRNKRHCKKGAFSPSPSKGSFKSWHWRC